MSARTNLNFPTGRHSSDHAATILPAGFERARDQRHILPSVAALILFAIAVLAPASTDTAWAQAPGGILATGNAVVTGFSGAPPPEQIAPGQDPGDLTFIDLNGPSTRVFNLQSPGAPPQAQVIPAPPLFTATAAQIGQVFGVAIDNATAPNIYVAATSAYGLPIVVPGPGGAPTRVHQGAPGAAFMAGLFGPAAQGGGPGSIWKIDGVTGAASLFANVTLNGAPNSGPALGGLAFDPASHTLIVADRQTGMIESFNLSGTQVGQYDHGVQGLAAAGQPQVPYTPSPLDITSPQFSPDNPATWDYAPPARRIFGLGVQGGRLYYAVAAGLQVWSVSIKSDGTFGTDARLEVAVPPALGPTEISKIIFDGSGDMILAERGAPTGDYELMAVAQPAIERVLRYTQVSGAPGTPGGWQAVPDQYAIGFAGHYTNANGGVAIGYNYNVNGTLDAGSCGGFLWSTGEQLRNSPDPKLAAQLAASGPLDLNGLQGNALGLVMPANVPPLSTYFVDYAPPLDDPAAAGHLGDIAIPIICGHGGALPLQFGGWLPPWHRHPVGHCPPGQMTPFGQCCPRWQVVDHGRCMCPGGAQPGQGGQCACLPGWSQQPGYLCCPAYTIPGANGCQSVCPPGSPSDQQSEFLCAFGFNPVPVDNAGDLNCLNGSPSGVSNSPGASNPPNALQACIAFAPLANPANCPVSFTVQPDPDFGGAPFCQPPPQCANNANGDQLAGGTCQNLCPGDPMGTYAYPTTQCCPNGVMPGPDGTCPIPPPPPPPPPPPGPPQLTCSAGQTAYCQPTSPPPGTVCSTSQQLPGGGCCGSGTTRQGNACVATNGTCPSGAGYQICCSRYETPNYVGGGCCPADSQPDAKGNCVSTRTEMRPRCLGAYVYDPAKGACVRHSTGPSTTPAPILVTPTIPPTYLPPSTVVTPPTLTRCVGGRIVGDRCECSSGESAINGVCTKTTSPTHRCTDGMVVGASGECQCPSGATNVNGTCVTTHVAVPCPTELVNGVCQPPKSTGPRGKRKTIITPKNTTTTKPPTRKRTITKPKTTITPRSKPVTKRK